MRLQHTYEGKANESSRKRSRESDREEPKERYEVSEREEEGSDIPPNFGTIMVPTWEGSASRIEGDRVVDYNTFRSRLSLGVRDEIKLRVFADLWERGYYVTRGVKFGGDFLAYRGELLYAN